MLKCIVKIVVMFIHHHVIKTKDPFFTKLPVFDLSPEAKLERLLQNIVLPEKAYYYDYLGEISNRYSIWSKDEHHLGLINLPKEYIPKL